MQIYRCAFPWESLHSVLQHLTPLPACDHGVLVVLGRAACEAQLGIMPTASTTL